jgi:hypothetical protein
MIFAVLAESTIFIAIINKKNDDFIDVITERYVGSTNALLCRPPIT